MQIQEILSKLEHVKTSGDGFTALCPAHEDKMRSLSICEKEGGKIVAKCFKGCEFNDIVTAMGLKIADFMPDNSLPKQKEIVYRLENQDGVFEHVRIDKPSGKIMFWRRDGKNGLEGYRIENLPLYEPVNNGKSKRVFITEGEKAAVAAAKLGCRAYGTVSGASSCPSDGSLAVCQGEDVVLWRDNDEPGLTHMEKIARKLKGVAKSTAIIVTGKDKEDAADFKGTANDLASIINPSPQKAGLTLIADNVDGAMVSLTKYSQNDTSDRIPTGITKVDYAMRGGMMKGALYLLGAPSGHGKTTLLQSCAAHCARTRGAVLFVSPEMSGEELAEREAIRMSGISVNDIAPSKHPNERFINLAKLGDVAEIIKEERLPIYVVEDTDITMPEVESKARSINDLKLIIVDYAQEIAERTATARYLAVGEVGKAAIVAGKNLGVPVLVASQVNVSIDNGKRNYTFRETKDLEHRAHCSMIMEVVRDEVPNIYGYYDIKSTRIFARKNRSGGVFSVDVDYQPSTFTIKDKSMETEY